MLGVLVSAATTGLVYSLVLVVGLWCWYQWKHWDVLQVARKLPCTPRPLPFIGHTHWLFKTLEGAAKMTQDMCWVAVSKGLYNICFWVGPMPILMIHKLEDIEKILTSSCTAEKSVDMDLMKFVTGDGLLTAPGPKWKVTRRHISPLFHPRNIEHLMPAFNSNSRELVAGLVENVGGEAVNTLHPNMSVALKTVCQIIFGTKLEFDTKSVEFKALLNIVESVPAIFVARIVKPWLRIDFMFKFLYKKEINEMEKQWRSYSEAPLKIAKNNLLNKCSSDSPKPSQNEDLSYEGAMTLVDILVELEKKYPQFTEDELKYEIMTLFLTGTDTVGLTVSSCLLILGTYHDIQDRVYKEIDSVVGPDDDVTTDHISRMQYLDQVFKETLRWSIVVPYILRKTSEELKLSNCTIPPGVSLLVGLIGPHMDPSIYPEPHKFDPDRFAPENSTSRRRHAFIPFSGGSRMCIGKIYSENLIKTMLVHVLRRFKVSTDMDIHNLKKVLVVTLVNSEGYYIKFQNRKKSL